MGLQSEQQQHQLLMDATANAIMTMQTLTTTIAECARDVTAAIKGGWVTLPSLTHTHPLNTPYSHTPYSHTPFLNTS